MVNVSTNVESLRSDDDDLLLLNLENFYSPESPPPDMDRELLQMVEFLETNLPAELSNVSDVDEDDVAAKHANISSRTHNTEEPSPNDERSSDSNTYFYNEESSSLSSFPRVDATAESVYDSPRTPTTTTTNTINITTTTTTTTNFFRDDLIARVRRLSNSRIDELYDNIVYHSDFSRYNTDRK